MTTTLVIGGLVAVGAVLFVVAALSGGPEGLVHGMRRLPDFSKGAPAEQREAYEQQVAEYDRGVAAIADKSFKLAFLDTCERSQYNWKVKSNYLASCDMRVQRLYLTNTPVCEALPRVADIIKAEYTNDGGCKGINPNGNYNDALTSQSSGIYMSVAIMDMKAVRNGMGPVSTNYASLFEGGICPYMSYCAHDVGDSQRLRAKILAEAYQTAIVLESSHTYYRQ